MAPFNQADFFTRKDWPLLQNGSISLYWRPEVLADDVAALRELGYQVHEFDCSAWQSEDDLHDALARELDFPGYYGRNLNALNDCLAYVHVPNDSGLGLVLQRYDHVRDTLGDLATTVLDIIADKSRLHLLFGRKLIALVQSDDPRISFDSLGCTHARWNHREWFNANRGL